MTRDELIGEAVFSIGSKYKNDKERAIAESAFRRGIAFANIYLNNKHYTSLKAVPLDNRELVFYNPYNYCYFTGNIEDSNLKSNGEILGSVKDNKHLYYITFPLFSESEKDMRVWNI